jgi:predicted AAA+ superfamily ATPase
MDHYFRPVFQTALERLKAPRKFIEVLAGPRQVGKTTLAFQLIHTLNIPYHYASADDPTLQSSVWIEQQWEVARLKSRDNSQVLLVLDEIQKVSHWSEIVKKMWDEDTRHKRKIKVVILGSTPLLIQKGLAESLADRFEIIPVTHWSFIEMHEAFGWSLNQFIYFGGYPGAATLIDDESRWALYIRDSLIETAISRDTLLMTRVLRRLFQLGCQYSGQIFSYQKMLEQLQDVGNTTTLTHYLDLLSDAGMLTGLNKFSGKIIRQRASSPKFQVFNTALISAQLSQSFSAAQQDQQFWGRLVESAVGAYLINQAIGKKIEIFYWREGNYEVDFVLTSGKNMTVIEVKSNSKETVSGMQSFAEKFHPQRKLLIGNAGLPLKDFFQMPIEALFSS